MSQELVFFQWLFVRTGWIVAKAWIQRLVSFELLTHADPMLVKVALVIVVDCLFQVLVTLRALGVGASPRVDRLTFLALDDKGLGATFQCQLLLEANSVLFVGLTVILCHILGQCYACFRTTRYITEIAIALAPFKLSLCISSAWHHDVSLDLTNTILRKVFLVQSHSIV